MPSFVEMQYDPYTPRLNILINGKQPPDFSKLIQYTDEDIWHWSEEILDTLYDELRDDFYIEFTGTNIDADILKFFCMNAPHCLVFKEKQFIINNSLQKRLGMLNRFIKKNNILNYPKTIVDAYFAVPQNMQHFLEDITSIDIGNLYCAVRIETSKCSFSSFEDRKNVYLFAVVEKFDDGIKIISRKKHINPAFILCIGKQRRFCGFLNQTYLYETTADKLIDDVFQCFLSMPLLQAFRCTVESLTAMYKQHEEFLALSLVEPEIVVDVASRVEAGKSTPIKVSLRPNVGNVPKLEYHATNVSVAECDGFHLFGKQLGRTSLEVYRYGEKKPFYIQDIEVFVRNRIKKIILSEDDITLGIGDMFRIGREYVPENADNVNMITWKSTNEQVIKVDSQGRVTAVGSGECRVLCSAENTSTSCFCTVKPYLDEIRTGFENNIIVLQPAQELKVNYTLVPANCFDSSIEMVSSNYDVVNIVGTTLYAKNEGIAIITIRNKTRRKQIEISAIVEKEKIEKKKTGFFRSLFGKE